MAVTAKPSSEEGSSSFRSLSGEPVRELYTPEDLPAHLHGELDHAPRLPTSRMTLEQVKRWYVSKVLEETGGNKLRAAEVLGIDRSTLYRMLERGESADELPEDEV